MEVIPMEEYSFVFEVLLDVDSCLIGELVYKMSGISVHEGFSKAKNLFAEENPGLDWFSCWVDDHGTILTVL